MRVCMHASEWVYMRGEAGRVGPTLLPKKLLSGSITSCLCLSGGPTRHTQVSWWASEELLPVSLLGIPSGRTPPRSSRGEPERNFTPPTASTQRRLAPKHSTSPPPHPTTSSAPPPRTRWLRTAIRQARSRTLFDRASKSRSSSSRMSTSLGSRHPSRGRRRRHHHSLPPPPPPGLLAARQLLPPQGRPPPETT